MSDAHEIVAAALRCVEAGSYDDVAARVIEILGEAGWEVRRADQSRSVIDIHSIRARWDAWTGGDAA